MSFITFLLESLWVNLKLSWLPTKCRDLCVSILSLGVTEVPQSASESELGPMLG